MTPNSLKAALAEFRRVLPIPSYSDFEERSERVAAAWIAAPSGEAIGYLIDTLLLSPTHLWNVLMRLELERKLPRQGETTKRLLSLLGREADVAAGATRALLHVVEDGEDAIMVWLAYAGNHKNVAHVRWVLDEFCWVRDEFSKPSE